MVIKKWFGASFTQMFSTKLDSVEALKKQALDKITDLTKKKDMVKKYVDGQIADAQSTVDEYNEKYANAEKKATGLLDKVNTDFSATASAGIYAIVIPPDTDTRAFLTKITSNTNLPDGKEVPLNKGGYSAGIVIMVHGDDLSDIISNYQKFEEMIFKLMQ